MQQNKAARPTATETAQAQLAGFLASPLIAPAPRAWHPDDELQADLRAERYAKAQDRRFSAAPEPITGWADLA